MDNGIITRPKTQLLNDVDGLQTRQLFLYKLQGHKDKGFIKESALSILPIKFYKRITVSRDDETKTPVQTVHENNSKGNTANIKQGYNKLTYSSEVDFTTDLEENQILLGSFEQLDIDEFQGTTNHTVFLLEDIEPSLIFGRSNPSLKKGELENPTDFSLSDLDNIRSNYQGLKFFYTWKTWISNPTSIEFKLNNYALLSKIMAKGMVENIDHQDIDLEINTASSSKLSVLTMTPTSTNYKLSLFSHWLDANRTLAWVKAQQFLQPTSLKVLFNINDGDFNGWSSTQLNAAITTIYSMMELTFAYSTNFKDYRNSDEKIIGEINGISLADFADKEPMNAVDGYVEKFKSQNPSLVETPGFKIMLEVIAMLSNSINSSYAIAKGNNDFNKVYLPWYFVPVSPLAKDFHTKDHLFSIESEYFGLTNTNPLQLKNEYLDISGYVAHDLNGWISQPELPNKISPINKFARPGDIDTKSDNELKYLFYVPYDVPKALEELYGNLHGNGQGGWYDDPVGERTFTDITTNNNVSEAEAVALINIPVGYRIKSGSIRDLSTTFLRTETSTSTSSVPIPGSCYYAANGKEFGCQYQSITTNTNIYTVSFKYTLQKNGSQTISSIQHKGSIFDKLNWRSVSNSLTNGTDKYSLYLEPNHKFKFKVNKISEINIQSIWLDKISMRLSNGTDVFEMKEVELLTTDDETLTNQTILLP